MPKKFDEMLITIKKSLKGKKNPETSEAYTDSDLFNITKRAYEKKYDEKPLSESGKVIIAENVMVRFNSELKVINNA